MAPSEATPSPGSTGPTSEVPEVDAVLAGLEVLDRLPVEEHVAVFEQAQEALRQALDGVRGAADVSALAAPPQAEG